MSLYMPSNELDDHENNCYPYGASVRHGERGVLSARIWEDHLDAAVSQADDDIVKFAEMRRPKEMLQSHLSRILPLQTGPKPRSLSASRLSTTTHSNKVNDMSPAAAMERKIDFVFRKTKLIDEKMKACEKEKVDYRNFSSDTMNAIRHIADAQAADQKQISSMRETIAMLKNNIQYLTVESKKKDAASELENKSPRTLAVDVEEVTEAVKNYFKLTMKEVVHKCTADQAQFLARWTEKAAAESDRLKIENRRCETETIPAVEKEMKRIISEFARLKGRQDSIDSSYHILKDAAGLREKRAEEAHKRAISSYKLEMGNVMDTVGKRMNDYLSMNINQGFQQFGAIETQTKALIERVVSVEALYEEMSSKIQDASGTSLEAISMAVSLRSRMTDIDARMTVNRGESNTSYESAIKQLRAEMRDVKAVTSDHQAASSVAFESLSDSHRKIKSKINELSAGLSSVSRIRQAVETLLLEVNAKAKDSELPGDLKNILIGIHSRLASLESQPSRDASPTVPPTRALIATDVSTPSSSTFISKVMLDQELSRIQSEIEEAVKAGWSDIIGRNNRISLEGAMLGEVVQRLQGVVLGIQTDQQGLVERIVDLENSENVVDVHSEDEVCSVGNPTKRHSSCLTPMQLDHSQSQSQSRSVSLRPVHSNQPHEMEGARGEQVHAQKNADEEDENSDGEEDEGDEESSKDSPSSPGEYRDAHSLQLSPLRATGVVHLHATLTESIRPYNTASASMHHPVSLPSVSSSDYATRGRAVSLSMDARQMTPYTAESCTGYAPRHHDALALSPPSSSSDTTRTEDSQSLTPPEESSPEQRHSAEYSPTRKNSYLERARLEEKLKLKVFQGSPPLIPTAPSSAYSSRSISPLLAVSGDHTVEGGGGERVGGFLDFESIQKYEAASTLSALDSLVLKKNKHRSRFVKNVVGENSYL